MTKTRSFGFSVTAQVTKLIWLVFSRLVEWAYKIMSKNLIFSVILQIIGEI